MTKKQLVPADGSRPSQGSFVAPVHDGAGGVTYVSMPGGDPVGRAMVVFVGREVDVDAFLVRMVDTGMRLSPSYEWYRSLVADFLDAVATVKIGTVVELVRTGDTRISLVERGRADPDHRPRLP